VFDIVVDVVRSLVIIFGLLTGMAYMTWFERRAISRLQIRIGPNRVGPTGLLQPVADALKLFFKEDLRPDMADRFLYPLAPGISLVAAPEGYVAGEESAVIHYLNGGPPLPTFVPPRPYQRGYRGRATLLQNPETLAQVALVARFGEHWYRELGTAADPGSALVTISGAVAAPGVYELAFGTPMTALLDAAGGETEPLRALLVGGYFGTWVDASRALKLRLARGIHRSLFPAGPPRYVRALVYEYAFTNSATRRARGEWWRREFKGSYFPVASLKQNE